MKVFVANRGEVAVRIIRACQELGFATVVGVSTADRDSLAARIADEVVVIGGARADSSYLSVPAVVHAAKATGCTAVHPGYGFLAENAEAAEACAQEGLIFIGPSPEVLRRLGDKLSARHLAESLNVPVSRGGTAETGDEVTALAADIGYPVLVKAAHGGGGKGMQLVEEPESLIAAWTLASHEAETAFGDPTVFLEAFVRRARHIEVQIIGDTRGECRVVGLRECSVQLRYQKVVEEAGERIVAPEHADAIARGAREIARSLGYVGLGTVEFLLDPDRDEVSFLEVNPRLQVEHPVTEAVTGIDLVREQILVCLGEPIAWSEDALSIRGHAIECRITAHDPERNMAPGAGRVERWRPPRRGHVRLDSHIVEGYTFPPYYDALMGKLIAWGPDRDTAVDLMSTALDEFEVAGIPTSIPLLRRILDHPEYRMNDVTTRWLTDRLAGGEL